MNKEEIQNNFNLIQEKIKEMRTTEKQVKQLDREITLELERYRNKSVERVLDYINDKCWNKENIDIDKLQTLVVHCLNKLNGNIDGIELSLEENKNE